MVKRAKVDRSVKQDLKIVKRAISAMKAETKEFQATTTVSMTNADYSGTRQLFPIFENLVAGTANYQRIGNTVMVKRINCKIGLRAGENTQDVFDQDSLIMWVKGISGKVVAATDLNTTNGTLALHENPDRVKISKWRIVKVQKNLGLNNNDVLATTYIKFSISFSKGRKVTFATGLAPPTHNEVYLAMRPQTTITGTGVGGVTTLGYQILYTDV